MKLNEFKRLSGCPEIVVLGVTSKDDDLFLEGRINYQGFMDKGMCYFISINNMVYGEVVDLNLEMSSFRFRTTKEHFTKPKVGEIFKWISAYWDANFIVGVISDATRWERIIHENNVSKDSFSNKECSIFDERIDSANPAGYRNQDSYWVCESCYEKYVKEKDVSFMMPEKEEENK